MKRPYKFYGIFAIAVIVLFVLYQFLFADRRSRLKVELAKRNELHYIKASGSRKLIREGRLYFEVSSLEETKRSVSKLATDFGGYISSETDDNHETGEMMITQTIRIPEASMNDFTLKAESLAKKIEYKRLEVTDVTEEYVDLEGRLVTKKKLEARYQEIIKQANTITDIMEVETQIATVRAEIDSMEGRLKYLSNNVAFGTISLQFHEKGAATATGYGYEIGSALRNGWEGLLMVMKLLVTVWPALIIASIVSWFYFRKRVTFIQ